MDPARALSAVATLAEACRAPDLWGRVADHAAAALGADGGAVGLYRAAGEALVRACPQTDPDLHRRYDADLHAANYLWAGAAGLPAGAAATEATLGGRERYHRSVIFNDFIRPQRMDATLTLNLTGPGGPVLALLTVGRRMGTEPFSPHDIAEAERLGTALARTLAACGPGLPRPDPTWETRILVTPEGRVLDRTAASEPLLRAGVAVIREGILTVPQMPSLHVALASAGRDGRSWPPPVGMVLGPVPTALGRMVLRLVPGGLSAPGAVRLIFAAAPDDQPERALRVRYGLTRRETDIALRLAAGETMPEAAEALGIALTTGRSHLAQLFEKTGTRSQLALALLVARTLER